MNKPKKPGIFNDPWRTPLPPPAAPVIAPQIQDDVENATPDITATVLYPGYGGISLYGTNDAKQVASHILRFCIEYSKNMEAILTKYGIILHRLTPGKLTTPFYIQDSNGWTLAIPNVTNRKEGLLQLIQALLEAYTIPNLKAGLSKYSLKPFKQ